MQIDDRLATVMRMRTESDAALRTQFRQLLDILGTSDAPQTGAQASAIWLLLDGVLADIAVEEQSAILRQPGVRLRNPDFVQFLAGREPKVAAAAMASARLAEGEWLELIPQLPVGARGFLRHRRDLGPAVAQQLQQLGVGDLVLPGTGGDTVIPRPQAVTPARDAAPLPPPPPGPLHTGIGELRRRIEAFQERRPPAGSLRIAPARPAPPIPAEPEPFPAAFTCQTDAQGTVIGADSDAASQCVGMVLTAGRSGTMVTMAEGVARRFRLRLPVRAADVAISAGPAISGEWVLDAAPLFTPGEGRFTGYAVRLVRPSARIAEDSEGDVMRQVLHELRTPVNAIQGFAEIIQQQLFGPVPHDYRAHAAGIAVDAAKLLAGFEEVDRLVRLEGNALSLEPGTSDLRAIVAATLRRLDGVLRGRGAGFVLDAPDSLPAAALDQDDARLLCWRLLATVAGTLGPAEKVDIALEEADGTLTLDLAMPEALSALLSDNPPRQERRQVVSAGMFGPAFAIRLTKAEAEAAGGNLVATDSSLRLTLPAALTGQDGGNSGAKGDVAEGA